MPPDDQTRSITGETLLAGVYVFALLAHRDKPTLDPMDVAPWEFYVEPTRILEKRKRSQHSITLASLRKLAPAVAYESLLDAVPKAALRSS